MDARLTPLLTPDEIERLVLRLAGEIKRGLGGESPVLIGVLKGAFVFISDLARALDADAEIDFVQTSSYGRREEPARIVSIIKDATVEVAGRDLILVEGIIDRGNTARALVRHFSEKGARSVKLCTLILRDGHTGDLKVDYAGVCIKEGFVAGYGMDYREGLRGLRGVYLVNAPEGDGGGGASDKSPSPHKEAS